MDSDNNAMEYHNIKRNGEKEKVYFDKLMPVQKLCEGLKSIPEDKRYYKRNV